MKQERALQEQASTYLQLVCSACDLAELRVREVAASIQQIKLQVSSLIRNILQSLRQLVLILKLDTLPLKQLLLYSLSFFQIEERMLLCEEVADSWRDMEEQKADLETQLRETEQQLQNLIRRPAELEPKIAQNQLDKAQVCV